MTKKNMPFDLDAFAEDMEEAASLIKSMSEPDDDAYEDDQALVKRLASYPKVLRELVSHTSERSRKTASRKRETG